MNRLHINSLIGQTEQPIYAHQRHDVLDLALTLYKPFLTEILNPSCVKSALVNVLTELVVVQNKYVQVRLV